MKLGSPVLIAAGVLAVLLFTGLSGPPVARSNVHSPAALVLAPDGKVLYVADQTQGNIAIVDVATGKVAGTVAVADPRGLALSADGQTLYASSGERDEICKIDTAARRVVARAEARRQPTGLCLSPDGRTLYCCNQFTDDVTVHDAATLKRTARLPVVREPRYATVTPDGTMLLVANQLPLGSNLDDSLGAVLTLYDLAGGGGTQVQLSRGATDVGQVVCSTDGHYAFVLHVLGRWLVPPTQLERGWISTNALTVVDLEKKARLNTVLLDDLDRGAANPWALALSPDGKTLYSTHAGGDEVQIIDPAKLLKLIAEWPADSLTALEDDLTAVYRAGVRQRVPSGGIGPRAVVATNDGAFVANYFSGTITHLSAQGKITQTIALGPQPPLDDVRQGEMFFHSSKVCFQGWQSCATCHPDGRTDGLAWDLMNDGLGNPKNAKSLLLAAETPPMMAQGVRDTVEVATASGYKYILFHMPTDEEMAATCAYLRAMKPARSPYVTRDGTLSAAAKRGKTIFERKDVACATCHPGPLFTDLKTYGVGTKGPYDDRSEFDTPTLVEMYRTAPYLHDGSAVTLREVLVERNKGDQHGVTSKLKEKDIQDLIEYLQSL